MNNRGQAFLVGMMIAVFVIMMALSFIDPLKDVIVEVRDVSGLDCTNTSITMGQSITCLATDLVLPYFIISVIIVGISYMIFKPSTTG